MKKFLRKFALLVLAKIIGTIIDLLDEVFGQPQQGRRA